MNQSLKSIAHLTEPEMLTARHKGGRRGIAHDKTATELPDSLGSGWTTGKPHACQLLVGVAGLSSAHRDDVGGPSRGQQQVTHRGAAVQPAPQLPSW